MDERTKKGLERLLREIRILEKEKALVEHLLKEVDRNWLLMK